MPSACSPPLDPAASSSNESMRSVIPRLESALRLRSVRRPLLITFLVTEQKEEESGERVDSRIKPFRHRFGEQHAVFAEGSAWMSAQKSRIKLEWVRTHPSTAICRQLEPITQAYRLPLPTVFHFGCGVSLICLLALNQEAEAASKRN